jgi:proline iminopeptidase
MAAIVYGAWVRPRLWRWGATEEEAAGPYPGADLVPDGERGATMAVTIEAPSDQVWPWLVQMGGDRGGWYSWDRLDNGGRPSAQEVHPEWQSLAVGDHVKYWTRGGAVDAWEVAALERNRFLGLRGLYDLRGRNLDPKRPRPSAYVEGLWGFLLNELPGGRTRLVIGGYQAIRPRRLGRFVFYVPVTWIMQARMLAVLKRKIERAAMHDDTRSPSPKRSSQPTKRSAVSNQSMRVGRETR